MFCDILKERQIFKIEAINNNIYMHFTYKCKGVFIFIYLLCET